MLTSEGEGLTHLSCTAVIPPLVLVSFPSPSRSHISLLVPGLSFQAHPGSKELFALWSLSAPDPSFPRKLFAMEPPKGRVSFGLLLSEFSNQGLQ